MRVAMFAGDDIEIADAMARFFVYYVPFLKVIQHYLLFRHPNDVYV